VKEGIGSSASVSAAFGPAGPIHLENPGYRGYIDPRALSAQHAGEHNRILMFEVIGEIVQSGYPVALLAE
jgi:hypothetical protein